MDTTWVYITTQYSQKGAHTFCQRVLMMDHSYTYYSGKTLIFLTCTESEELAYKFDLDFWFWLGFDIVALKIWLDWDYLTYSYHSDILSKTLKLLYRSHNVNADSPCERQKKKMQRWL